MPIPYHKFGQITIAKVNTSDELKQILIDPWLESEIISIKPNWGSNNRVPIDIPQEEFGAYNKDFLKESKLKVGDWLSP